MGTLNDFIKKAQSFIGVKEGTAKHREIIDKYNTLSPLPRGYKVTYNDAWCATFVSFIGMVTGVKNFPYECGCQEMFNKGNKTSNASVGALVFYDWSGTKNHATHVGIVEKIEGNNIIVIEGNKDDSVSRRTISKTDPSIYGYCVLDFDKGKGQMSDKQTIWNFLFSWLKNPFGAAGLMGNIRAESALRANNLQDRFNSSLGLSDEDYTKMVDNGSYSRTSFINDKAGYGLCQWTYWSRKRDLYDYLKKNGFSIGNLSGQLNFMKLEMETNYPTLVSSLKSAKNVLDASNAVLFVYERPGDQSKKVQDLRASYGQELYNEFGGKNMGKKITRTALLNATMDFANRCRVEHWKYFDSHSWTDNGVSCDRLFAKTLKFYFDVDEQPEGGCETKGLARTLFPKLGFTKITDQSQLIPGDIVIMGANVKGKPDNLNHMFMVVKYDPVTKMCYKLDFGAQWRIDTPQPFKNVPLNEWGTDPETGKWFTEAWRALPDEDGEEDKTPEDCIREGQHALNKYFGAGIDEDGSRGSDTETAFISAFQQAMNEDYYDDGPMPVNGRLTKLTVVALGTHYVEYREKPQRLTTIVEIGQLLAGRDPGGVEEQGNYGTGLVNATGKKRMNAQDILAMFRPELIEK